MKRRPILGSLAAFAALAVLSWYALFWLRPFSGFPPERPPVIRPAGLSSVPSSAPSPSAAAVPADPYAADAPSHLADRLNDPGADIRADLRILNDIFQQYRSAIHGDDPVGDNIDITAALTGHNKLGFAFIPRNHPAIDARGELCDRWGAPFFFHQLSGSQMEIRSAGPDRKLWTADDEVLTPGLHPPQL